MIEFFHEFEPPTTTAQQRRFAQGRTWQDGKVKKAKATLQAVFEKYAPPVPMDGNVSLQMSWTFPHTGTSGKHHPTVWKNTRPDVDNLMKLAMDVLQKCNYYTNDSRVVSLLVTKHHGCMPGIYVKMEEI